MSTHRWSDNHLSFSPVYFSPLTHNCKSVLSRGIIPPLNHNCLKTHMVFPFSFVMGDEDEDMDDDMGMGSDDEDADEEEGGDDSSDDEGGEDW